MGGELAVALEVLEELLAAEGGGADGDAGVDFVGEEAELAERRDRLETAVEADLEAVG